MRISTIVSALNLKRDLLCTCRLCLDRLPERLRNSKQLFMILFYIFRLDEELYSFRSMISGSACPQKVIIEKYSSYNVQMRGSCSNDTNSLHLYCIFEYLLRSRWHSLLDVGCGNNNLIERIDKLSRNKLLQGVDIRVDDYQSNAQNDIQIISSEITSYLGGIEDQSIDVVTCLHVLEHLPNYIDILNELKRIARIAIILAFPLEKPYDWGMNYHVQFFERGASPAEYIGAQYLLLSREFLGDMLIIAERN